MPSRFSFYSTKEEIQAKYNIPDENLATIELHPYYNLKPTNRTTAIINDNGLKVVRMKWGFVKGSDFYKVRAESINEKKLFSKAFKERRCVVLANGFFEWEKEDKKSIPYYFTVPDEPLFTIAGIFNKHLDEESGEEKYQCAVVTVDSNELVGRIFHRMPVIFKKPEMDQWLEPGTTEESLLKLLKTFPGEEMKTWQVERLPARGDNGPDTIKPVKPKSKPKKSGLMDFV